MDSTREKKRTDHRVDEKNVTSGAATLERAWIHTDPAKKINKKTAPHQTYFVCSSLLMMVATATAKAPSTERVSCNESHFQTLLSTRKFVSQNRYPGAADSWASVFRPDFRPKRCHHPKPCQKIETATQPQHGCLMAHLFPCTATSDELLNI